MWSLILDWSRSADIAALALLKVMLFIILQMLGFILERACIFSWGYIFFPMVSWYNDSKSLYDSPLEKEVDSTEDIYSGLGIPCGLLAFFSLVWGLISFKGYFGLSPLELTSSPMTWFIAGFVYFCIEQMWELWRESQPTSKG